MQDNGYKDMANDLRVANYDLEDGSLTSIPSKKWQKPAATVSDASHHLGGGAIGQADVLIKTLPTRSKDLSPQGPKFYGSKV